MELSPGTDCYKFHAIAACDQLHLHIFGVAEAEQMLHSLEQRYVKLRDEHVKVKAQRDELLGKETALEEKLAEEQRQSRSVGQLSFSAVLFKPAVIASPLGGGRGSRLSALLHILLPWVHNRLGGKWQASRQQLWTSGATCSGLRLSSPRLVRTSSGACVKLR